MKQETKTREVDDIVTAYNRVTKKDNSANAPPERNQGKSVLTMQISALCTTLFSTYRLNNIFSYMMSVFLEVYILAYNIKFISLPVIVEDNG